MTDNELLTEAVRILQRMESEWIGSSAVEGGEYVWSWPLPMTFVIQAMAICMFWDYGLRLWKYFIYVKNHKEPWLLLAALLLPCSVASAQDITSGKVYDYDLFANVDSTGGSVSSPLTQVGSLSVSDARVIGFSGSNYLTLPSISTMAGDSSYSISLWAKAAAAGSAEPVFSIGGANTGGNTSVLIYPALSGGPSIYVFAYNSGNSITYASSAAIGAEAHIVLVVESASVAKLYVNGALAATSAGNLTLPATLSGAAIGRFHASSGQFFSGGAAGQLKIFNRALTASDVAALKAADQADIAAVRNPAPVNTSPPVVSGTMAVGSTLTASPGTWTGASSFTYQWYESTDPAGEYGGPISGATSASLMLTEAQVGLYVYVVVTASGEGGGAGVEAESPIDPEQPVAEQPPPGPTGDWGDCDQCGSIIVDDIDFEMPGGNWYSVYKAGVSGPPLNSGATCDSVIWAGLGWGGPAPEDCRARFKIWRSGRACPDPVSEVIIVPDINIGPNRAFELGHTGTCEDSDGDCKDDPIDCDDNQNGIPDVDEDDDGDGIPNDEDDDDDNDGCKDNEECEDDDEDGIPNCQDPDDDNDGTADHVDCDWHGEGGGCWPEEDDDPDDDGVPSSVDPDDDNDGIPDWIDLDDDGDGIPDEDDDDWNGNTPPRDSDGDGIPDDEDPDDDNDGIPDEDDDDKDGNGIDDDQDPGFVVDPIPCAGPGGGPSPDGASCCPVGASCEPGMVICGGGGGGGTSTDPCGGNGCEGDQDCDGIPDDEDDDDDGDGTPDDEECEGDQDCDGIPDEDDDDDDGDGDPDPGSCACCEDLLHELRGIKDILDMEGDPAELPAHTVQPIDPRKDPSNGSEDDPFWGSAMSWWKQTRENVGGEGSSSIPIPVPKLLPEVQGLEWGFPEIGDEPCDYQLCMKFWLDPGTTIQTNVCLHTMPLLNVENYPELEGVFEAAEQFRIWGRRFMVILVTFKMWRVLKNLFTTVLK